MKIGIDIRPLGDPRTGIGRFLHSMLIALSERDRDNEYRLFYNSLKIRAPRDIPERDNFRIAVSRFPNRVLDFLWSYSAVPRVESFLGQLDVFHSPNYQMAPTRSSARILTIYDLTFITDPELAVPGAVSRYGPRLKYYLERTDLAVTISKATASDIMEYFNYPQQKLEIIYPAPYPLKEPPPDDFKRVKAKFNIDKNYILFVGNIEPRKNLGRLIRAFGLSGICDDYQLVLVGHRGWSADDIFEALRAPEYANKIKWLDYITDDDLTTLYSNALFFAYPSLKEGFGLPILEAMTAGCPVLTSQISSMPEAAGDSACYIDPHDVHSIAEGIRKLASDSQLREELVQKGKLRAKMFTWKEVADRMIEVYRRGLDMKRH